MKKKKSIIARIACVMLQRLTLQQNYSDYANSAEKVCWI